MTCTPIRASARTRNSAWPTVTSLAVPGNGEVVGEWVKRWVPLADAAIDAYLAELPGARAERRARARPRSPAGVTISTSPERALAA